MPPNGILNIQNKYELAGMHIETQSKPHLGASLSKFQKGKSMNSNSQITTSSDPFDCTQHACLLWQWRLSLRLQHGYLKKSTSVVCV